MDALPSSVGMLCASGNVWTNYDLGTNSSLYLARYGSWPIQTVWYTFYLMCCVDVAVQTMADHEVHRCKMGMVAL